MLNACDFYLPSTTFNEIKLQTTFTGLPNNRGYGIVLLKDKDRLRNIIEQINWQEASFKSTNSANNLRTQLIIDAIENQIKKLDLTSSNKYHSKEIGAGYKLDLRLEEQTKISHLDDIRTQFEKAKNYVK
ncbi:hypothetical protein [Mycoplasma hafezii]|uniref:hypothetical protein n=1 Tax=Mycoplasma hafezii TaxID=525886 RepID=UPI003CECE728